MSTNLDAAGLLRAAETQTGSHDYGDPTLPERFAIAVDHLNGIGMDADGIRQAAQVCRWLLTSRLEFIEDRNRYPIDDEVIAAPMFHIAGVGSIVPTMLIGGTVVILPSGAFDSSRLLDVLENERVTTAFLVPTQWQAVCSDPSVSRRDLAALRVTCWGAAPASDTLLRRMAEVFPDTLNVLHAWPGRAREIL